MVDFGYLFFRIVRFYGVSRDELLDWPISTFWLAVGMINRIQAEEGLHAVRIKAGMGSKENLKNLLDSLTSEVGTVYVEAPKRDQDAVDRLRRLASPK